MREDLSAGGANTKSLPVVAREWAPIYLMNPRGSLAMYRRLLPVGALIPASTAMKYEAACYTAGQESPADEVGGAASQEAANPFAVQLRGSGPNEISVPAEEENVLVRRVQESTAKLA